MNVSKNDLFCDKWDVKPKLAVKVKVSSTFLEVNDRCLIVITVVTFSFLHWRCCLVIFLMHTLLPLQLVNHPACRKTCFRET